MAANEVKREFYEMIHLAAVVYLDRLLSTSTVVWVALILLVGSQLQNNTRMRHHFVLWLLRVTLCYFSAIQTDFTRFYLEIFRQIVHFF